MNKIITRALTETVIDIGQLSTEEIKELNAAVKRGWLSKGKGGGFPAIKTVYAFPGFDFAQDRERQISELLALAKIDAINSKNRIKKGSSCK